jgi:ubiquinone/menaquinone biosynthesis C-methylase UbiE
MCDSPSSEHDVLQGLVSAHASGSQQFCRARTRAVVNDYDSFAEAYVAQNEDSLLNGYYTRPAILNLAGDVAGRRILDVGCGAGPISAALRERGATVAGFDSSTKMLELARKRLGPDTDLRMADLGSPLPYPDGAFDDVIAALVLHYLEDWTGPLTELRRVLRPGGRLILDPAAARNDRRVHRSRLPDSRHQRAVPRTRHPPRTAPRLPRGQALGNLPSLPVLRPGSRLTAVNSCEQAQPGISARPRSTSGARLDGF